MRKETAYFNIGSSYGSSQQWMTDPSMNLGGCGAIAACDMCIYLAMYKGRREVCPLHRLPPTRREYIDFASQMKPYLSPRMSGIRDTSTFIDGAEAWLRDRSCSDIQLSAVEGCRPSGEAWNAIRESIDDDMPLCCLMLKHTDREFDFFRWHWFIVNGYDDSNRRKIKTATYSRARWLDFDRLWDTGYEDKGGLVFWKIPGR